MTLLDDLRRKADDPVLWLGTVSGRGRPTVRPVWFVLHDDAVVVFSTPDAAKIRHLRATPHVVLSFTTDPAAEHVFVVSGEAVVALDGPPASTVPGFLDKYASRYPAIGLDSDGVDATYSARITITPTSGWGW